METSDRKFDAFAFSVAKDGKERCGDAFVIREYEREGLLLLAVADGVSSCPCDWLASETACVEVAAEFEQAAGNVAGRMKLAARRAHAAVRNADGECRGMLTSLTLAVWETGTDLVHFLNVGDSRLYLGRENDLRQMTRDDTGRVLIRIGGEVLLNDGMPVFKRGVTRSLGQIEPLDFVVETARFTPSDLLVLVSDGISKNEVFTSDLGEILGSGGQPARLEQLVAKNSERNGDDATLLVLRRTEADPAAREIYAECVRQDLDFREKGLAGKTVTAFLEEDLRGALADGSNERVRELFGYADRRKLKFGRLFLSEFLSLVIRQGTDRELVFRLREMIRTADD